MLRARFIAIATDCNPHVAADLLLLAMNMARRFSGDGGRVPGGAAGPLALASSLKPS